MELETYQVENRAEESHWWFVNRRRLFAEILREATLATFAPILDVGTSTGTNLRLLDSLGFTNFTGLDFEQEAVRLCALKGFSNVRHGDACEMPFENASFEFVLATDILEHIPNDGKALREISRVVTPSGRVLITVPAFEFLWGLQDNVSKHERRYGRGEILAKLRETGFVVEECFFFNYILFIPIFLARQVLRIFPHKLKSENQVNSPLINRILTLIFALDVWSSRKIHPPFGVSLLILARKKQES